MWDFEKWKDKTAIIVDADLGQCKKYSYQQLIEFSDLWKGFINGRKLVLIAALSDEETLLGYVACIREKIPVMMVAYDRNSLREIVEIYKPKYIWKKEDNSPSDIWKPVFRLHDYVLYECGGNIESEIYPELALLLSTSGSTGSKKFVRLSYRNLTVNTQDIIQALKIHRDDCAMAMLPYHYTYGLSVINTYLESGATLLIPSYGIADSRFWKFAAENNCTAICGVPVTYDLLRTVKFNWSLVPSLKLATQAGGKLSLDTEQYILQAALRFHFNFAVMYGQTEASARISCHFLNEHPEKIGSVGKVLPHGELEIKNGEIIYYGLNVMMGYAFSKEDLKRGDENHGVLHTGDLGCLDDDEYLYITGRKNRITKICGYRISLDELENQICLAAGAPAACIEKEQKIILYSEKYITMKEVLSIIRINPHYIEIKKVNKIPRKENGKIDYKILYDILSTDANSMK